ncbi:cupin domain-containing protein [Falsiroseomonas oryziterrae]|uniref:cupin domain-containing protein n=1 Tax=Falsiroseomonas oryziterrae TaxID=2911368 RepID=UPI001F16858C|nr:cupin domain-containing protein [Roseomonas sp. NPKOSM-4]
MPDPNPSYALFGNVLTFLARPSAGAPFLVSECRSAPGAGAPPNRHAGDDEAFYVLSGRYEFSVDGETRLVGPGDCVAIPNGAAHAFRNPGPEPASMLIVNGPGRQHEDFFSTLGQAVAPGTVVDAPPGPPPEDVLAGLRRLSAACGVELLV